MKRLAVFIRDTKDHAETETVENAEAVYVHYKLRRGPFSKRRLLGYLKSAAEGACTLDADLAKNLGLPLLEGNGARLVHENADRLLPKGTNTLVLYPGVGFSADAIVRISQAVRYLELCGGEDAEALSEWIADETGLSVPVFTKPKSRGLIMRLPGAESGAGLDLTEPWRCTFLPPPPLRRLCRQVGADAANLEALLSFFGFSRRDVDVFCRNIQK